MSAVETVEEALETAKRALEEAESDLARANLYLVDVPDMRAAAAAGDADAAEVERYAADWGEKKGIAAAAVARERETLAGLERRREQALRDDAVAIVDELDPEIVEQVDEVRRVANRLGGTLKAAIKQAAELAQQRSVLDELLPERRRAAAIAGVDIEPQIDEPQWLPAGVDGLLQLLQGDPDPAQVAIVGRFKHAGGGPRRPGAAAAAQQEHADDEAARRRESLVWRVARQLAELPLELPQAHGQLDEATARVAEIADRLAEAPSGTETASALAGALHEAQLEQQQATAHLRREEQALAARCEMLLRPLPEGEHERALQKAREIRRGLGA